MYASMSGMRVGQTNLGSQFAGGVAQLVDQSSQQSSFLLRLGGQQLGQGTNGLVLDELQVVPAGYLQHADELGIPEQANQLEVCSGVGADKKVHATAGHITAVVCRLATAPGHS